MKLLRGIAAAAACAMVLASCSDPTGPADETARLEKHRRLWSGLGVDSYRMTVRLHGAWFGGAAVIEVRGGVPVSFTPLGSIGGPAHRRVFEDHDTVEELFAVVQDALDRKAEHLEVRYGRRSGIPSFVDVDLSFAWADDEYGFSVEDFRVLK